MAINVKPLYDFDKCFEIYFKNEEEFKKFDENGNIFGYKPFQNYMEHFDDTYGYWITYSISHGFFGSLTYCYAVHICEISE